MLVSSSTKTISWSLIPGSSLQDITRDGIFVIQNTNPKYLLDELELPSESESSLLEK